MNDNCVFHLYLSRTIGPVWRNHMEVSFWVYQLYLIHH